LFGRLAPGALGGLGEDQPESPPEARGSTPNPRAAPGNRPPRLSQGGRSLPPHLSGLAGNGDRTRRRSPSRGGHRHEHRSRAREKQGATIVYVFGHGHHRGKMIRRHLWFRRHDGQPSQHARALRPPGGARVAPSANREDRHHGHHWLSGRDYARSARSRRTC
jgi:hypothetical protein